MPTSTFLNLPDPKRERVLDAAMDEFSQRNVEHAKVSNIVRLAGIPRGSFYQYFLSMDDLYVYSFETLRERRREFTRPAFNLYKTSPFLDFYERFYLLDSQYLLAHPKHIEMGKIMYSHGRGVSASLIKAVQQRYRDIFIIAIAHDQDLGRIRADVDASQLVDLCVHFVTDVFVFQALMNQMSLRGIHRHLAGMIDILRRGIE